MSKTCHTVKAAASTPLGLGQSTAAAVRAHQPARLAPVMVDPAGEVLKCARKG